MPTPPSVSPDYTVVGGAGTFNTWGQMRTPLMSDNVPSGFISIGTNCVDYLGGFQTSAGNGLMRTPYGWTTSTPHNLTASLYSVPSTQLKIGFLVGASTYGPIDNDDRQQLIGQVVSLTLYNSMGGSTGTTVTLNSDSFDYPNYQIFGGAAPGGIEMNSVTAFNAF